MWETEEQPPRVVCGVCDTVDTLGDDFCVECGHSLNLVSESPDVDDDGLETAQCPSCLYGFIHTLSYGVRQCESCGYTARDGAPT